MNNNGSCKTSTFVIAVSLRIVPFRADKFEGRRGGGGGLVS